MSDRRLTAGDITDGGSVQIDGCKADEFRIVAGREIQGAGRFERRIVTERVRGDLDRRSDGTTGKGVRFAVIDIFVVDEYDRFTGEITGGSSRSKRIGVVLKLDTILFLLVDFVAGVF